MKTQVNLRLTMWKAAAIALAVQLSLSTATSEARIFKRWTLSELFDEADVVVVGTIEGIEDVQGAEIEEGCVLVPVNCHFRVNAVMKGDVSEPVMIVTLARLMTYGEWLDSGHEGFFGFEKFGIDREDTLPDILCHRLAYDSLLESLPENEQGDETERIEDATFILFLMVATEGGYEPVSSQSNSVDAIFRLVRTDR